MTFKTQLDSLSGINITSGDGTLITALFFIGTMFISVHASAVQPTPSLFAILQSVDILCTGETQILFHLVDSLMDAGL